MQGISGDDFPAVCKSPWGQRTQLQRDYECLTVTRNHRMMNNAEVVMKTDPRSSMVTGLQR